tara:strand:- start:330 stop:848 length:519 start_codon:yes stop_codon:yes gene_type:complete
MALTKVTGAGVGTLDSATITSATISNQLTDTNMSAGSIIQIVQNTYSTASQTGGSDADTGLDATITPQFSSSKILIMVNQPLTVSQDTNSARDVKFEIYRGSSTSLISGMAEISNQTGGKIAAYNAQVFLDSPNTTSATTYKTKFGVNAGSSDVYAQQHGTSSNMILMEIRQ